MLGLTGADELETAAAAATMKPEGVRAVESFFMEVMRVENPRTTVHSCSRLEHKEPQFTCTSSVVAGHLHPLLCLVTITKALATKMKKELMSGYTNVGPDLYYYCLVHSLYLNQHGRISSAPLSDKATKVAVPSLTGGTTLPVHE